MTIEYCAIHDRTFDKSLATECPQCEDGLVLRVNRSTELTVEVC